MVLYLGRLAIEYDQHDEVAKRARAAKAKQEEVARIEEAKKELLQKGQERRSATTNSVLWVAENTLGVHCSFCTIWRVMALAPLVCMAIKCKFTLNK